MSKAKFGQRPSSDPDWLLRQTKGKREIWLCCGCIDSIEKLDSAVEFLGLMRPLMMSQSTTAPDEALRAVMEKASLDDPRIAVWNARGSLAPDESA